MPTRWSRTPASNPTSISWPFSARRSGLPNADTRSADPVRLEKVTLSTVYVWVAEYAEGARPAAPQADRSLKLFTRAASNAPESEGSSVMTHDAESFG